LIENNFMLNNINALIWKSKVKNCFLISFLYFLSAQNVSATPANLASHRAVYDLSLLKTGNEKQIEQVNGRIAIDFAGNECSGFSYTSRQVTNISDGESPAKQTDMRVHNWENSAGTDLKFKSVMREGSQTIIQSEGRARRDQDGEVSVKLHRPHLLKIDLDGKAQFPTAHTRELILASQRGDRFLSTKIYDGSEDGIKIFDVAAIIGQVIPAESNLRVDDVMRKAGLSNQKRWPVHLSYFEQRAGERLPAYQLKYDLFENGITTSLVFVFPHFSLKGNLVHLEVLPTKTCNK
jgi:EipB-like